MASSNDEWQNWLLAFIQAEDLTSSRLLVEAHPGLLNNLVDDVLAQLAEAQGEAIRHVLLWRRDLLHQCREAGIAAAYAQYAGQDYPLLPTERDPAEQQIIDTVLSLLNTQSWGERKRIVEAYRDQLLTNTADTFLSQMIEQYKDDASALSDIKVCKAVLMQCRSESIDSAFAGRLRLEYLLKTLQDEETAQSRPSDLALAQEAVTLIHREQEPERWATLHLWVGRDFLESKDGERAKNIEQAIKHIHVSLEVFTRESSPHLWAQASSNLGTAYQQHVYGEPSQNIEQAISFLEASLEVYTQEEYPEERAGTENNLGLVYAERTQGNQEENLERALAYHRRALTFYTLERNPAIWAGIQLNLAEAYKDASQYLRERERERIDAAIAYYQQALRVYTREDYPEQWANIQLKLANTSIQINTHTSTLSRTEKLERAISYAELALAVYTRTNFPEQWAQSHLHLGLAYSDLDRGERTENVQQAIKQYQLALEVYTRARSPDEWARLQHNLAKAYNDYGGGNRAENLEQAIAYGQRALEVRTKQAFPDKWALAHTILGLAYVDRVYGEHVDNLEQAIAHFQMALQVFTREAFPIDWARVQNNLGTVYLKRGRKLVVENGIAFDNIERAVQHFEWALEVRTKQDFPFNWAQTQLNLANAYLNLVRGSREDNLERAIDHCEQTLEVWTQQNDTSHWAQGRRTLARAYAQRTSGQKRENLEKTITNLHLAAEVFTRQDFPYLWAVINNDLGNTYIELGEEGTENLERAIVHYQNALEVFSQTTFPADRRDTLSGLGTMYFHQRRWKDAYAAYEEAIKAGETLISIAYTETGRKDEISKLSQLYTRAAYCLIELEEPAHAFLLSEQGKARLLASALALDEVDLATLSETQRLAMVESRRTVQELGAEQRLQVGTPHRRTAAELGDLLQQVHVKLNQLIESIRADDPLFMQTDLDLLAILALVPVGGALVAPIITPQGAAVYILPHGLQEITSEHILLLPDLNEERWRQLLIGTREEPGWVLTYSGWETHQNTLDDWMATIDTTTSRLWEILMGPVHERLGMLGLKKGAPVTILPQGGLGLLPLHAAWHMVEGTKHVALDDYTFTYAPGTYVLSTSQRHRQSVDRHEQTLLAVINPTGDLFYTSVEGNMVAAHFEEAARQILIGGEVTKKAVLERVGGKTYVHFSCHGYCDWVDFMHSRLLLAHHELLTMADIISPQFDLSSARLVTLSACETGQSDFASSPDEYIGLATAFLQAGASAVLSSLWAVNDLSTALLMQELYRRHLTEGQGIPEALREAQLWLRQITASELHLAEYWEQVYLASGKADVHAFRLMRYYRSIPNYCPFAHAYYWAAFTFTGA